MNARATTLTVLLAFAWGGAASAQTAPLYSNGSADPDIPALSTGAISASGAVAPPGASWSELQADKAGSNAVAGFSAHRVADGPHAFRVADDFIAGDGWTLRRLDVFVYQTGFDGPVSPIAGATARIWWGVPDAPSSVLLWGDTQTNRVVDVVATDVYRVFNSVATPAPEAPAALRRVWRVSLDLGGYQPPPGGHYWIDWQFESDNPDQEIFAVPATLVGERAAPGANALRLDWRDETGWLGAFDTGKPGILPDVPQDFAFVLVGDGGIVTPPVCPVDWDNNGVVNSTDVAAFINSWFEDQVAGTFVADFDDNGVVNSTDVSTFINVWFGSQPYCS